MTLPSKYEHWFPLCRRNIPCMLLQKYLPSSYQTDARRWNEVDITLCVEGRVMSFRGFICGDIRMLSDLRRDRSIVYEFCYATQHTWHTREHGDFGMRGMRNKLIYRIWRFPGQIAFALVEMRLSDATCIDALSYTGRHCVVQAGQSARFYHE